MNKPAQDVDTVALIPVIPPTEYNTPETITLPTDDYIDLVLAEEKLERLQVNHLIMTMLMIMSVVIIIVMGIIYV